MKSHIQLNKAWMEYFAYEKEKAGKYVYVLDLKKFKIMEKKIKILGTKENYYNLEVEKIFSKYEKIFGEIVRKIKKNVNANNKEYKLEEREIEDINSFIAINCARSMFTNELFEKITREICKDNIENGFLGFLTNITKEKFFETNKVRFVYNNTKLDFVLPSYCQYKDLEKEKIVSVIPINNKILLIFDKDGVANSISVVNDKMEIEKYNKRAFLIEKFTNSNYIISKTKEPLKLLQNYRKELKKRK